MSWHHWDEADAAPEPNEHANDNQDMLAEMIIDLKRSNCISAKQACILAHWACEWARSGAGGLVESLAQHPETQSGHFSRHFDRVTGLESLHEESPHYHLWQPRNRRSDATRSVELMPTLPPHEALSAEIEHIGIA